MPINALQFATIFQQALDQQMIQQATTGWMEANAGQVKYNGGNEVKVPIISTQGMGDYDRDNGFVQGSVSLVYGTYVLTQDRGRTFHLDAMDVDESNFVATASNVMGEFQRLQVIPEIDSYRYSKIAALAQAAGKVTANYDPATTDILSALKEDIATVQDKIGENYQLVITMPIPVANKLDQADKIQKTLSVSEFKQGNASLKVTSLDNHPIIRVPSSRMFTSYISNDGTTPDQEGGGLTPDPLAKKINWLITVRQVPLAISKTEKVRIFTPDTNQRADAWKLDYRKYHDLWVLENKIDGVHANIAS